MILVCDIDGTLSDHSHRFHIINKDPCTAADFKKFLAPDLVAKDTPLPKAKKGLGILMKMAAYTYFLTSRQSYLEDITRNWLKKHMKLTVNSNLCMRTNNRGFGKASEHKEKVLNKVILPYAKLVSQPLIFVDDDPYVLSLYSRYGLALKAPECWDLMIHKKPAKPEQIFNK